MSRASFHLRSKDQFVCDDEEIDLPDPATALGAADKIAAEFRGGLLHESRTARCWTVAVTDEGDELVHVTAL